MTTDKLPFPPNLPPLPEPPAGHQWVYRGPGFSTERREYGHIIYCFDRPGSHWTKDDFAGGSDCLRYAEAVKIESPAEPDYASREYQKSVLDAAWEGKLCDFCRGDVWFDKADYTEIADAIFRGDKVRIAPQPDPYADLKAAKAAGKVIEKLYAGGWVTWISPDWTRPPEEYRIKLETKRIPLTAEDIPAVCWVRAINDDRKVAFLVHIVSGSSIWFMDSEGSIQRTLADLMDRYECSPDRLNWNPCYKETRE